MAETEAAVGRAEPAIVAGEGPSSWAVVGGGVMGLAVAGHLARAGWRVTVYEAAPEVGGLAVAWSIGGVTWDRHYHVILSSDLRLRALLEDLGLTPELMWRAVRTGFFTGGELRSMSGARDYLTLPGLGLVAKVRLAATLCRGAWSRPTPWWEERTAESWLEAWSGREVLERFWRPLLRAKLGGMSGEVNAGFIRSTIARLASARRRGLRQEEFGHVRGGYARILATWSERLVRAGVDVRTAAGVERVASLGGGRGVEVVTAGGARAVHRGVVVTTPPAVAAGVCADLTAAERERLASVPTLGLVCAVALLRRPLGGFYVTNLADAAVPFTGVIEMTALVNPAELGGRHLVYLPRYLSPGDEAEAWDDDRVRALAEGALARVFRGFVPEDIVAFRVSRVRHVMAVPVVGYTRRHLPPRRTPVPGVHLVNSAQITDGTLNVESTLAVAERGAREIVAEAAVGTPSRT